MKLKFFRDAFYNGEIYASAGEVKEVPEGNGFALRWIRRGAEPVVENSAKVEAPKAQEVKLPEETKVEDLKVEETKVEETIKVEVKAPGKRGRPAGGGKNH